MHLVRFIFLSQSFFALKYYCWGILTFLSNDGTFRIYTSLVLYEYIDLRYQIDFGNLRVYYFTSGLTQFCLLIYVCELILVIYNPIHMTVSIIIIFMQIEILLVSALFIKYNIWDRAPMVSLFTLVSTWAFHTLIYRFLDQRDAQQRVYSVVKFLALK